MHARLPAALRLVTGQQRRIKTAFHLHDMDNAGNRNGSMIRVSGDKPL
jgi:hypothetical protein